MGNAGTNGGEYRDAFCRLPEVSLSALLGGVSGGIGPVPFVFDSVDAL